jgi:hypothetical protein
LAAKEDIWVMSWPAKEIARNFLSVCFGVAGSIGVFYFFFLLTAVLPRALNSTILLTILLGFSSFAGGFVTAAFATKHKLVLAIITSMILVVLYIKLFDSNYTDRNYPGDWLQLVIIFILSLIGGVAGALPAKPGQDN